MPGMQFAYTPRMRIFPALTALTMGALAAGCSGDDPGTTIDNFSSAEATLLVF